MLDYVKKLTVEPQTIVAGDVDALRDAGFDDVSILDICQMASYFNYVNRLADGVGVELEDHWTAEEMTLTREELIRKKAERE